MFLHGAKVVFERVITYFSNKDLFRISMTRISDARTVNMREKKRAATMQSENIIYFWRARASVHFASDPVR